MAYYGDKYYSADSALSYNRLLKHFRDQASGNRNMGLMNTRNDIRDTKSGMRKPRVYASTVLVDMGDKKDTVNQRGEHVPKVEIVDNTEGDRRRAVAQAAEEKREGSSFSEPGKKAKRSKSRKVTQSKVRNASNNNNTRRGSNANGGSKQRKKRAGAAATKQSGKEPKNIFD